MSDIKKAWTPQEVDRLRHLYPRSREEVVARALRRSVESVRRKAAQVFRGSPRRGPWTEDELWQLREGYGALDVAALCLVLNRSVRDVREQVRRLRNQTVEGPWTPRELAFLKRIHGHRKDRDLVVCLSRPLVEIRRMARELRLGKDKGFLPRPDMPRWTERDVAFLRERYASEENIEIARLLNRSVASVANKANQLGLRKGDTVLRRIATRNVGVRYDRPGEN